MTSDCVTVLLIDEASPVVIVKQCAPHAKELIPVIHLHAPTVSVQTPAAYALALFRCSCSSAGAGPTLTKAHTWAGPVMLRVLAAGLAAQQLSCQARIRACDVICMLSYLIMPCRL